MATVKLIPSALLGGVLVVLIAACAIHADQGPRVESSTQIFLARSDGSELRKLTSGPSSHSFFSWSPDGQRIAYSSARGVMVANLHGSSRRLVTAVRGLF